MSDYTHKPFSEWAFRHPKIARLIPVDLLTWLLWQEIKRDPKFMEELSPFLRSRSKE